MMRRYFGVYWGRILWIIEYQGIHHARHLTKSILCWSTGIKKREIVCILCKGYERMNNQKKE